VLHVPLVAGSDCPRTLRRLAELGFRRVGAVSRGGTDYSTVDWTPPTALVMGNESGGLPAAVSSELDVLVEIPMAGRAESLNVGVAAAILCFEALRQRRTASSR
jgi:tRNA G18 (ribose-2'-O)-methylase SpoU